MPAMYVDHVAALRPARAALAEERRTLAEASVEFQDEMPQERVEALAHAIGRRG
ncbi:hypothetical protein [Streptomyces sp. GZWMJZ-114]|uniref:hypothetical protein n=1 Tax=Streptomyces sp. GZWMJZ-114 TaxID=2494734 RepID=UPI0013E90518|nr:hypothetical protein [Streptomyces sp. GZWMJZ-114]